MTRRGWAPVVGGVAGVAVLVVVFAPTAIERRRPPAREAGFARPDDALESLLLHERFAEAFDLGLDRLAAALRAASQLDFLGAGLARLAVWRRWL